MDSSTHGEALQLGAAHADGSRMVQPGDAALHLQPHMHQTADGMGQFAMSIAQLGGVDAQQMVGVQLPSVQQMIAANGGMPPNMNEMFMQLQQQHTQLRTALPAPHKGGGFSDDGLSRTEQIREKNRIAQRRFRERQKAQVSTLQAEVDEKKKELEEARCHIARLEAENAMLREQVTQFTKRRRFEEEQKTEAGVAAAHGVNAAPSNGASMPETSTAAQLPPQHVQHNMLPMTSAEQPLTSQAMSQALQQVRAVHAVHAVPMALAAPAQHAAVLQHMPHIMASHALIGMPFALQDTMHANMLAGTETSSLDMSAHSSERDTPVATPQ